MINPPMRKFLCSGIIITVISSVRNYFTSESPTQGYSLVQKTITSPWKDGSSLLCHHSDCVDSLLLTVSTPHRRIKISWMPQVDEDESIQNSEGTGESN